MLAASLFNFTGASAVAADKAADKPIVQYAQWKDTDGNPINAHGGGILYHNGKYYWYGEYKKGETILPDWAKWECYRTDVTGVSCYSSPDMVNWTFEGIVLPAEKDNPEAICPRARGSNALRGYIMPSPPNL